MSLVEVKKAFNSVEQQVLRKILAKYRRFQKKIAIICFPKVTCIPWLRATHKTRSLSTSELEWNNTVLYLQRCSRYSQQPCSVSPREGHQLVSQLVPNSKEVFNLDRLRSRNTSQCRNWTVVTVVTEVRHEKCITSSECREWSRSASYRGASSQIHETSRMLR